LLLSSIYAFAAAASGAETEALHRATQPLNEGVPEVAVVRLREFLHGNLSESDRAAATTKLAEALVASGQAEEALRILSDPHTPEFPGRTFWRAQALAALSRWAEALPVYQQSSAEAGSPFRSESLFGQTEALRALGRIDEALSALHEVERDTRWIIPARFRAVELLLDKADYEGATRTLTSITPVTASQRKERRFLRGRIEAKESRATAIELYGTILKNPEGATHPIVIATLFALAEAQLQSHRPEAGETFLEEFIERHPADADLPEVFAKLDQLYAAERQQSLHDLGRWSNDPAQPRRALAQWYLARANLRLRRPDLARQTFEQLRSDHPALPSLAGAFFDFAQLALQEHRYKEAVAILGEARGLRPGPELSARIEMLSASSKYHAQDFAAAGQTFRQIAQPSFPFAKEALFDSTLAWLQAGDTSQATAAAAELKSRGADDQMRGDLQLEQALLQATRSEGTAAASLENFLRDFPQHPRVSEAHVALAELAFHATPARLDEARQQLARAEESKPTPAAQERADYLMIWLEDAASATKESKVIELATQFLQNHAASEFLPEVRLKLAESYYRRQDFASAQTQFEILAQRNPNSPLAEKALFFSAQSAAQSMGPEALDRALALFDQVVKLNGQLKWAARNEQAVIERKAGKPQDALTLYDEVLKGDAQPPEQREALCAKGDILYELGATDPENYRRAIELYHQLATQHDVPAHWRNQALFKKGMCLEKLNAPADALATFYSIIDDARPGRQREFFWYYKAGFNAARLLEADSKWKPAAAVYEKLAFAGGARTEEAKSRLNQLRLEHFLWEE
jgi:outer membrane protein assembly factor BamD (BamD/ComL family)